MKRLIIFDVCNTLVDTNSTFSYVDFLLNCWIRHNYKILFHSRILWYFYYLIYLLFKFDLKILLTKKYFKGLSVNDVKKKSWEFFKWYESRLFPNMLDIIKKENGNSKIILLSSSINPPIDFLKNKYKINWFSSILEEKDWVYTWKTSLSLRWQKELVFKRNMVNLDDYERVSFYTDNVDDIWLINYLNEHHKNVNIYIVPYKNKKYWNKYFSINKINHEFVD